MLSSVTKMLRFSCRAGLVAFLFALPETSLGQAEWEREWEKTLTAAKQEGQVVVYHSTHHDLVLSELQRKYPEIKLLTWGAPGSETIQRIMGERRAGKYLVDFLIFGSTSGFTLYQARALEPIEPMLLLPEVLDRSKWWQGKFHYADPDGKYMFIFNGIAQSQVGYNSNQVNPAEFQSYWDLLTPKWRGKIVVSDPETGGVGTALRFLYHNPDLGPPFLRRLFGEMDVTVSRDERQIADWLASGKFAISMLASPTRLYLGVAKEQGLPVGWFGPKHFKEGAPLSAGSGFVYVPKRAPHPHAAKVALNWLLSREGQLAAQRIYAMRSPDGIDSLRIDIPKDHVPSHSRRVEGINYLFTEQAEWVDIKPIRALIREVRQKAGK